MYNTFFGHLQQMGIPQCTNEQRDLRTWRSCIFVDNKFTEEKMIRKWSALNTIITTAVICERRGARRRARFRLSAPRPTGPITIRHASTIAVGFSKNKNGRSVDTLKVYALQYEPPHRSTSNICKSYKKSAATFGAVQDLWHDAPLSHPRMGPGAGPRYRLPQRKNTQ